MPATAANRSTMHHPTHYDDYDSLNSSEEEEERLLSHQYGEASEDINKNSRKRPTSSSADVNADSDGNVREDVEAANKEFESKLIRTKKPRPVLLPSHLKGSNGLVSVRRSFPSRVGKFRSNPSHVNKVLGTGARSTKYAHEMNRQAQISTAAYYSRNLMSAYRDFARELFPSQAWEDVFFKIEDLGSKKEVKDFLNVMRDDAKREYLEEIYGVEKSTRLLRELEFGLRQQQQELAREEEEHEENQRQSGNSRAMASSTYDTEDEYGLDVAPRDVAEDGGKGNKQSSADDVFMENDFANPQLDNLHETPTHNDDLNDGDNTYEENKNTNESIAAKEMGHEDTNESNDSGNGANADKFAELENEPGFEANYSPMKSETSAEPLIETQDISAPSSDLLDDNQIGLESFSHNTSVKFDVQEEHLQECHDTSMPNDTSDKTPAEESGEGEDFQQNFTQDDRFSQVSVANENEHKNEHYEDTCDEQFSLMSAVETNSQEEGHTGNDRFSQLSMLESSFAMKQSGEPQKFDSEDLSRPEVQFESSQLSMEY
ncbi:hypothetical protein ACHAXS_007688 [Conticribra weissflogii]